MFAHSLVISMSFRLTLAAGSALALAPIVSAQPKAVEPYMAIVTASDATLRCGDGATYYQVASLKPGTLLRVDGESGGYLRVMYPAGVRALVLSEEAQLEPAGKSVKLTRPTRLKASNLAAGPRSSWNFLMDKELPPGTELQLADAGEIKDDAGKTTHFAIIPPMGARAFISEALVRKASNEEIAQANKPVAAPDELSKKVEAVKAEASKAIEMANKPAPAPAPTPAAAASNFQNERIKTEADAKLAEAQAAAMAVGTPAPAKATEPAAPASNPAPASTSPSMPTVGGKMSEPPIAPAPVDTTGAGTTTVITPGAQPATSEPAPEAAPSTIIVPPARPKVPVTELIASFQRVMKQPLMDAEYDAAIGEFQRAQSALGSSDADNRVRTSLQRYVDAIKLRQDVRDAKRRSEESDKQLTIRRTEINQRIAQLQQQKYYTVIGRVVSSEIYDGTRQPLMYRIVSPEPGFMRTLGYILPSTDSKKFDLAGKIGMVIGIEGDTRRDEALKANIITPRRIDVISLSPMGEVIGTTPLPPSDVKPATKAPVAPAAPAAPAGEPETIPMPEETKPAHNTPAVIPVLPAEPGSHEPGELPAPSGPNVITPTGPMVPVPPETPK
jgi:hypothetical protein